MDNPEFHVDTGKRQFVNEVAGLLDMPTDMLAHKLRINYESASLLREAIKRWLKEIEYFG